MLKTKQSFKEGVSPIPNTPASSICHSWQLQNYTIHGYNFVRSTSIRMDCWLNQPQQRMQESVLRISQNTIDVAKQACTSMFPESFTYNNIRYRQSPLCCSWSSLQSLYTVYMFLRIRVPSAIGSICIFNPKFTFWGGSHLCSILPVSPVGGNPFY